MSKGTSLEALKGCEELFTASHTCMRKGHSSSSTKVRCSRGDLVAWLRERGYTLSGVYGVVYDNHGRSVQADMLFRKTVLDNVGTR